MCTRRVFILGAGFSKQAGMPLATELTKLIINKFKEYGLEEALSWFEWLKQRIDWMEAAGGDINIEQVFDFAHYDVRQWRMEQHRCLLGRMAGDTPYNKAENIEAWLSYMEDSLRDVIWEEQRAAYGKMEGIERFTQDLREDDVVLAFNYDTLLEKAVEDRSIKWSYGFKEEVQSGLKILKMHGSINWLVVPRNQADNFGYPVLFKKVDKNREGGNGNPVGESEYDNVLLRVPDDKLANRIENRDLQLGHKQYSIGIAGLGRYKPLDKLPGSGEVWFNARKALREAEEVYVVGFSLSQFDTMARLYFAGAMISRSERGKTLPKVTVIDPCADRLKPSFQAVFGPCAQINACNKNGEDVDWESFVGK